MNRLSNWQADLSDLVRKREAEPFDIVKFNCLMWACEAIQAVTGEDYYKPFRGKFKTAKGAARTLIRTGKAKTSSEYLEAIFGERKHLAFIRKGDIVFADVGNPRVFLPSDVALFGPPVGICYGDLSYFVGESGLVTLRTLELGPDSYGLHCQRR